MSTRSLNEIIKKYWQRSREEKLYEIFNTKNHIAALILSDIYTEYELYKETKNLEELHLFLNARNSLKHILNILNNSDNMSIDIAILNEIKLIKNLDSENNTTTLFSIIESVESQMSQESKEIMVDTIIEKLTEARLYGTLDEDGRKLLMQPNKEMIISDIIILDEAERPLKIFDHIDQTLSVEAKVNVLIQQLKDDIFGYLTEELFDVHKHLNHVAEQLYNRSLETTEAREN